MALSDQLRRMDAHSGVSKEFRVYTVQGAVLSVITVVGTFLFYHFTRVYFGWSIR